MLNIQLRSKDFQPKLHEWTKTKFFQIGTQEYGTIEGPLTIFVFVIITPKLLHNAKTTSQSPN